MAYSTIKKYVELKKEHEALKREVASVLKEMTEIVKRLIAKGKFRVQEGKNPFGEDMLTIVTPYNEKITVVLKDTGTEVGVPSHVKVVKF